MKPTRRLAATLLALVLLAVPAGAAVDRAGLGRAFGAWIDNDIWPEAKAAGVSRAHFRARLQRRDAGLGHAGDCAAGRPAARPRPEHQAEFGSPGAYFNERRLDGLAAQGRARLAKWKTTLAAIEKRYGVPAGHPRRHLGARIRASAKRRSRTRRSATLATQAFIGRRQGHVPQGNGRGAADPRERRRRAAEHESSWAGALGQPQFLPSQFLKYAVDFDGDGRRDIWNSVPDSLASIANICARQGWNPERGWGLEASVPQDVACTLEGPEQGQPMEEWARRGVTRSTASALPGDEPSREASS